MANAFYRSSSSSTKKKSERESRQAVFFAVDDSSDEFSEGMTGRKNDMPDGNVEEKKESIFSWRATITPSALVTISILTLVMLGFSFLSGVIVGRSSMPLPQALELDTLLSEPPKSGENPLDEPEKILPKEELRFMTNLKNDAGGGILSNAKDNADSATSPQPAEDKNKKSVPEQKKKEKAEPLFDYTLRVAAYKNEDQAKNLASRLSKEGIKSSRTQKKAGRTTWHYVQVSLRGSKGDLQILRKKLDAFGLHDAMITGEKPVRKK